MVIFIPNNDHRSCLYSPNRSGTMLPQSLSLSLISLCYSYRLPMTDPFLLSQPTFHQQMEHCPVPLYPWVNNNLMCLPQHKSMKCYPYLYHPKSTNWQLNLHRNWTVKWRNSTTQEEPKYRSTPTPLSLSPTSLHSSMAEHLEAEEEQDGGTSTLNQRTTHWTWATSHRDPSQHAFAGRCFISVCIPQHQM